jgi:hypothetical protein
MENRKGGGDGGRGGSTVRSVIGLTITDGLDVVLAELGDCEDEVFEDNEESVVTTDLCTEGAGMVSDRVFGTSSVECDNPMLEN